jgi:hypothetical protein
MKNNYDLKFNIFGFVIKINIKSQTFSDRLNNTFNLIDLAKSPDTLQVAEEDFATYSIVDRASCPEIERAAVLLHRKRMFTK